MKISTRGRYALRMMLDIARNCDGATPVSLAQISERTGISRGYLEQLALALRTARLVRGVSGRYGGYLLAKPSEEITIGQILQATLGPICVVDCIEEAELCPRSEYCECRVVYSLINKKIADVLEEYTLADLAEPSLVRDIASSAADTTYMPSAVARRQRPAGDDSSSGH